MKLIKTKDKFILVSDEETLSLNGDFYLGHPNYDTIHQWKMEGLHEGKSVWINKIIAGIPSLLSIDFSLLSEEDCKKIGWVDVDKLAKLQWGNVHRTGVLGFIEGFKTAQSLNDKMFSLKDMEKAIKLTIENCWVKRLVNTHHPDELLDEIEVGMTEKEIIQSIQQTSWDVEVEIELNIDKAQLYTPNTGYQPKIKNNSIKVLRIL